MSLLQICAGKIAHCSLHYIHYTEVKSLSFGNKKHFFFLENFAFYPNIGEMNHFYELSQKLHLKL